MKYPIYLFLFLLFLSCKNEQGVPVYENPVKVSPQAVNQLIADGTAARLIQTNCFTCHNPAAPSHDEMLAPPLVGMKYKYQQAFPKRDTFIYAMTNFLVNPTKENAIMRGPVRRFGVMPKSVLKPEEIQAVVTYLYDNEVEAPDWFAKHFEEEQGAEWKGN